MVSNLLKGLISTQNALLKTITPNLRAVTIDIDPKNKILFLHFFYEGPITEEIREEISCIIVEASTPFPVEFKMEESVTRIDPPAPIPKKGHCVFLRKEESWPSCEDLFKSIDQKDLSNRTWGLLLGLTALLGKVTPELRAVTVKMNSEKELFSINFYYDKEITSATRKLTKEILSSIKNHLPSSFRIQSDLVRKDYPAEIHYKDEDLAYARKELLPKILFLGY